MTNKEILKLIESLDGYGLIVTDEELLKDTLKEYRKEP